jgi:hypothetical protein
MHYVVCIVFDEDIICILRFFMNWILQFCSMLELFAKHNSLILGLGEVLCFKPKTFVKPNKFLNLYLEYALVVVI